MIYSHSSDSDFSEMIRKEIESLEKQSMKSYTIPAEKKERLFRLCDLLDQFMDDVPTKGIIGLLTPKALHAQLTVVMPELIIDNENRDLFCEITEMCDFVRFFSVPINGNDDPEISYESVDPMEMVEHELGYDRLRIDLYIYRLWQEASH